MNGMVAARNVAIDTSSTHIPHSFFQFIRSLECHNCSNALRNSMETAPGVADAGQNESAVKRLDYVNMADDATRDEYLLFREAVRGRDSALHCRRRVPWRD